MQNYFSHISDAKQVAAELAMIYKNDVTPLNRENFLQVLKHRYHDHPELSVMIKDMAYKIVVAHIPVNSAVVAELRAFNKEDKQLVKDTMRFRLNLKKG